MPVERLSVKVGRKISADFQSVTIEAGLEADVPKGKKAQAHAKVMVKECLAICNDAEQALNKAGW